MTPDPVRSDARRAHHRRKLGPDATCTLCGLSTPEALIVAKRSILEAHHTAGRANDPGLTVLLCRNCHAVQTEGQRAAGVDFSTPPTFLHQLAAALTSLGIFFAALGDRFAQWADALGTLLVALDREAPAWRSWPEAQAWRGL